MKNAFGLDVCEIKDVFKDKEVEDSIRKTFSFVLDYLGISAEKSNAIIEDCLTLAKSYDSMSDYEKSAHTILEKEGVTKDIPKKLTNRAQMIHGQIRPFVEKSAVLDFGCGDGKVGELVARDGFNVVLADIYKHTNIGNICLGFKLLEPGKKAPFGDNEFDNTLVLTVIHHADEPFRVIEEACRVTKPGGLVIVIESVYGVNGEGLTDEHKERIKQYLSLSKEQQAKYSTFFDHFYNRVIHYNDDPKMKVNVPFNFNTPDGWEKVFEDNGFVQEKFIHLGVDQPTVPEYHTLHVLRVAEKH
jgi:SAM-dependent methyltransferase